MPKHASNCIPVTTAQIFDALGKDAPSNGSKDITARSPPRCAPDANCPNAAVGRPFAQPGGNSEATSVSCCKKGTSGKLGRRVRNNGAGWRQARVRDRRVAQERCGKQSKTFKWTAGARVKSDEGRRDGKVNKSATQYEEQ